MSLLNFGAITDDSGLGQDGTSLDAAFWAVIKAAIEAVTHSTTNPTVDPNAITDEIEVIKALKSGGTWTDLKDALDGVVDFTDGSLITPASIVSMAQLKQSLRGVNIMINDTLHIWHAGPTSAPTGFTLAGAGASIAQCGTGLGDTNRKVGPYSAKVTYGTANAELYRTLIDAAVFGSIDHIKTTKVGGGAWVKASTASQVRLFVGDGQTPGYSDYHTGGGGWEFLTVVHEMSGASTYLDYGMQVKAGTSAYIAGLDFGFGDHVPTFWRPAPKVRGCLFVPFSGAPAVADGVFHYVFQRPALITDIQAFAGTACGGADDFDIDLEKWNGADWTESLFSAPQTILTGAAVAGSVRPDGDYANRCFTGVSGATIDDGALRLNLDVVGGNIADIRLMIRVLQWTNPLEDFLAYNDI